MVKCGKCGKEIGVFEDYVKVKGVVLCIKCSKGHKEVLKEIERGDIKGVVDRRSSFGSITFLGIISTIICLIAGISMLNIQAELDSIMLAYYHSVGVFVIGIGLFIAPLLYGIDRLVHKN